MLVPTSTQIVAFRGSNESISRTTARGWILSPPRSGIADDDGGGRGALREGFGGRLDARDSTNARPDVAIPSDVATNRPNADGSGSTWTTSAFSLFQRGENERVVRPPNETPTAINKSHGVSKRYSSALPSPNKPSTPRDSGCVSGTIPRPFG